MKVAIVSITKHGIALSGKVHSALIESHSAHLFCPAKFSELAQDAVAENFTTYEGKVGDQLANLFEGFDVIVCIVSLGAVVRLISPHLKNKTTDPAVLVIDEAGKYVISVLSGHLGGANLFTEQLAKSLGAIPVITTASDARQTLAVDLLGKELGWSFEATHDEIVRCSAAVVNDEAVALIQEAGDTNWWSGHAGGRAGKLPNNIKVFSALGDVDVNDFAAVLWISNRELPNKLTEKLMGKKVVYKLPSNYRKISVDVALGIGCDRDASVETIDSCIELALKSIAANINHVAAVGTIDIKNDEIGLLAIAKKYKWQIKFYSAEKLDAVEVPSPSELVKQYTGTGSVAEASAILAGGVDKDSLLVEKYKYLGADGKNVTVAVVKI